MWRSVVMGEWRAILTNRSPAAQSPANCLTGRELFPIATEKPGSETTRGMARCRRGRRELATKREPKADFGGLLGAWHNGRRRHGAWPGLLDGVDHRRHLA